MNIKKMIRDFVYNSSILLTVYQRIIGLKNSTGGGTVVANSGIGRVRKDCVGINNTVRIGKGTRIDNLKIRIRGDNNTIEIGNECTVGKQCSIWAEGNNIKVRIGDRSTFTQAVHICAQEDLSIVELGEDNMFSNSIIIRTSDSHPIYDEQGKRINSAENVKVGNHVWIAPDVKIFKGVTIGDGAIIGSNTLVTHDIPENSLAVGYPAQVVKKNITWTREQLF